MSRPKFAECLECKFFNRTIKRSNPICGECDNGEFFEARTRSRAPSQDELMRIFERMQDDN